MTAVRRVGLTFVDHGVALRHPEQQCETTVPLFHLNLAEPPSDAGCGYPWLFPFQCQCIGVAGRHGFYLRAQCAEHRAAMGARIAAGVTWNSPPCPDCGETQRNYGPGGVCCPRCLRMLA
jgi:hypothetical protein